MLNNLKDGSTETGKKDKQYDPTTKYKILIVEDERASQTILEKLIRMYDKNIEVISVDSGAKGLCHYFKNDFDIVFLDILMAHIDGNDFVKIVEENMKAGLITNKPNIIIQTSITSEFKLALLARNECILEIIRKPVTKNHIQECLPRYLS